MRQLDRDATQYDPSKLPRWLRRYARLVGYAMIFLILTVILLVAARSALFIITWTWS